LGTVLYELLTGRPAFGAGTALAWEAKQTEDGDHRHGSAGGGDVAAVWAVTAGR
jgi:hypothetical protein